MWQEVTIFREGIWARLAGFEVHKIKIEGDDVTTGDDFQKRSLSSVGRIWGPQIQKLGRWVSGDAFHAHIFSLIYKSHSVSNCNSGWHIANLARTRQISGESIPANQFSSFLSFGIERFSNFSSEIAFSFATLRPSSFGLFGVHLQTPAPEKKEKKKKGKTRKQIRLDDVNIPNFQDIFSDIDWTWS